MRALSSVAETPAPHWLNRTMYPFTSHRFESDDGRMHYVDEGAGNPIVFVHGTPTWSFLYRHLIRAFSPNHRAIAVDHLGFGLSDKPPHAPYAPDDHARRLIALLDALDVSNVTLVVHDFGGPIGLAAALARPQRIARLVLFNTWMWDIAADPKIARGARVAGSRLGRLLYRHLNFPVRWLMPSVMADRRCLTMEIHRHYAAPLGTPDERMGAWGCARALLQSGPWFEELWSRRRELRDKPMLLVWGLKDPTFGPPYLERWRLEFPKATVHTLPSVGHFVPEEAGMDAVSPIGPFVNSLGRFDM